MKNIVFAVSSVIMFILFIPLNLFSVFRNSLGTFNFIISLVFVIFWGVMIVLTSKSRKMMIYSISFWSITLITSLIVIIAGATSANIGIIMIPSTFIAAPFSGFGSISMIVTAVISAIYIAGSTYELIKKAK